MLLDIGQLLWRMTTNLGLSDVYSWYGSGKFCIFSFCKNITEGTQHLSHCLLLSGMQFPWAHNLCWSHWSLDEGGVCQPLCCDVTISLCKLMYASFVYLLMSSWSHGLLFWSMNCNTFPPLFILFILILNLFYIWPVGTTSSPSDMSHYSLSTFRFTGIRCFQFIWYPPCPWNQPFLQGILSLQWHLFSQWSRKWDHQRRVRTRKVVSEVQAEGGSHLSLKWAERPVLVMLSVKKGTHICVIYMPLYM